MSYYLRAFCTTDALLPLGAALSWTATHGVHLELAPDSKTPLDFPDWSEAELTYRSGRQPFVVDISRAGDGELLSEEIEEFVELLDDVPDSPEKDKVLDHVRHTRAVIAAQLLGDAEDEGVSAAATFLGFFRENSGGMIQADGEGFYDGERLVVELQ